MKSKHFTTTVYIIHQEKVLLLLHPKFEKWLPPGGHIEENETPPEAAKREVLEETGFDIKLVSDEHLWMNHPNTCSIERPFHCALQNIPSFRDEEEHQHIDLAFLAHPRGVAKEKKEVIEEHLKWFSLEEIETLTEDDIFHDVKAIIKNILAPEKLKATPDR